MGRVLLVGFSALLTSAMIAVPAAADRPQEGPLTIEATGSFGEPDRAGTVLPWTGHLRLTGVVEAEGTLEIGAVDYTLEGFGGDLPSHNVFMGRFHLAGLDLGLSCRLEGGSDGSPTGGPCRLSGDLHGDGLLAVTAVELRPHGVFDFTLSFRLVRCRVC